MERNGENDTCGFGLSKDLSGLDYEIGSVANIRGACPDYWIKEGLICPDGEKEHDMPGGLC